MPDFYQLKKDISTLAYTVIQIIKVTKGINILKILQADLLFLVVIIKIKMIREVTFNSIQNVYRLKRCLFLN